MQFLALTRYLTGDLNLEIFSSREKSSANLQPIEEGKIVPDKAEGLSVIIGSGENAVGLEDLWTAKELLSTFGLRKNLLRWFGGVGQPTASILHFQCAFLS